MTERSEKDPLRTAIREHLLARETAHIFPTDKRIGAFVGASTEMVQEMLTTGRLLEHTETIPHAFIFTPTRQLLPRLQDFELDEKTKRLLTSEEGTREEAEGLGKYPAKLHYFMNKLGIDFTNVAAHSAAMHYLFELEPSHREAMESNSEYATTGMIEELNASIDLLPYVQPNLIGKMVEFAKEAQERKGILLGIDKTAHFTIQNLQGELTISCGERGIPYTAITAIEPLSIYEEKFLEKLRR